VATRLSDSRVYRHLWTAPELDALFDEPQRIRCWLGILQALAAAQAAAGLIPSSAAAAIADLDADALDLEYVAERTRATAHSTLGLIDGLRRLLPDDVHRYVYYGATVQDVTDTWFGLVMRDVGRLCAERLAALRLALLDLARAHRETVMAGRTHGQPGAPVTFGFKVAGWADEVGRHLARLAEGDERWSTGQLAGAVGTLSFFGTDALAIRRDFCARLGLGVPAISWLTSRDRVAEFGHTLAMVCAFLARIGGEVYELQRPEIGELREPRPAGGVSSITMPHKRNPEASEHLATLARLVRSQSGVLLEAMDQQHERDGRGWKSEWIALPEVCELTVVALNLALQLVSGLEVGSDRMRANVDALGSEHLLARLAERIGKHRAQALLQEALRGDGATPASRIAATVGGVSAEDVAGWLATVELGAAGAQVDAVLGAP
jgi:adenylosuccinate lyase